MIAPFGRPGSVTPAAIEALPAAMQREGILLLMEMGLSAATVARTLGWRRRDVSDLIDLRAPFRCACLNPDANLSTGGGE